MSLNKSKAFCFLIILLLLAINIYSNQLYPLIESMDQSNILFKQISDDISSYYRNSEQNLSWQPDLIYLMNRLQH